MWSATTAALVLVKKQGTGKKHFAFLLTSWSSAWILVASGWKVKAGRWLLWSKFDPKRLTNVKREIMKIFLCPTHRFHVVRHEFHGRVMNMNEVLSWLHDSRRTHPITRPCFPKVINLPYCFKSHLQICLRKVTTITFNSAMSACEKNNEHSAVQKLFLMMHQHKVEPDRPPVDVFSLMFFVFFSADIDVFLPACRRMQQLKCATWEHVQIHNKTY